jgi:hypothetical protein
LILIVTVYNIVPWGIRLTVTFSDMVNNVYSASSVNKTRASQKLNGIEKPGFFSRSLQFKMALHFENVINVRETFHFIVLFLRELKKPDACDINHKTI